MKNNLKILPVDKAYCLHVIENKDRLISSSNMFKKINCLDEIEYYNTCYMPKSFRSNNMLYNTLQQIFLYRANIFEYHSINQFSCMLNHYMIIKKAYLEGYEHICVFEDDVNIIDINNFLNCMKNMPNDYNIINFIISKDINFKNSTDDVKKYNDYFLYLDYKNANNQYRGWCTTANFYDKIGMKYYIDYIDNNIFYADSMFFNLNELSKNIKLYFTEYSYIIHDEENSTTNINHD